MSSGRSMIAWKPFSDAGSIRSASTSIHGRLSAASPMNGAGAVFIRRATSPTRSAGYAITALISLSVMRCARALGRIAICTPQSVLPLARKVQYTFRVRACRTGMGLSDATRWGARGRTADRQREMIHQPVHASWLNQIEIYFSAGQRNSLTHNDFPDLDTLADRLKALEARDNKQLKSTLFVNTVDNAAEGACTEVPHRILRTATHL